METHSPKATTTTTAAAAAMPATATVSTTTAATGTAAAAAGAAAVGVLSPAVPTTSAASTVASTSASSPAVSSKSLHSSTSSGGLSATTASGASSVSILLATAPIVHAQTQCLTPAVSLDVFKQDDINISLASGPSEGQRSLSGAPSASSSPILSPQGKIFGRNANGTMISTSRPGNEAEVQLYRVLQRASLLAYYDTLLEMGGDDVQQLYDAGEEEFLEIMALVGMASKPLHVRRLQKALHEWANNPSLFQGPVLPHNVGALCETPPKPAIVFNVDTTPALPRTKFPSFNPVSQPFQPTPLLNPSLQPNVSQVATAAATAPATASAAAAQLLTQISTPVMTVPVIQSHSSHLSMPSTMTRDPTSLQQLSTPHQISSGAGTSTSGGSTTHQVTSSSPQLTPVLTELQVQRITLGAEKIARQLPQREPRAHTSKKRTTRELEQVIAMSTTDPRRMEEIRKYSAIYGRFDCKRRPEKPLTLHEVCVNEAAAQLCHLVPALLTRRDELFPLARQIVKDAGFGHSASIARYGGLLTQLQAQGMPRIDCESSEAALPVPHKRQRLSSTEAAQLPMDLNRETVEDSRYNLFAMYQKFAKPPFDLTEIAKFSLGKADFEDNDNDSRFSFSNSSSPPMPMPTNGAESERCPSNHGPVASSPKQCDVELDGEPMDMTEAVSMSGSTVLSGVQVISAAGGNIIAVANPALALSPTLNEVLALKRTPTSPEI